MNNKPRLQVDFLAVSLGGSAGVVPDVDGAYVLLDTKNWLGNKLVFLGLRNNLVFLLFLITFILIIVMIILIFFGYQASGEIQLLCLLNLLFLYFC